MVARCLSSLCMSGLVKWRNPYGGEEYWPEGSSTEQVRDKCGRSMKVYCAQAGEILLCPLSLIEAVAYGVLSLVALSMITVTPQPFTHCVKLCQSALFTVRWTWHEARGANIVYLHRPTHESFARQALRVAREEDREYIEDLKFLMQKDPLIDQYFAERALGNSVILSEGLLLYEQRGAAWIREHIFDKVDEVTRATLLELEPEAFSFIAAKTAFEYIFGAARNERPAMYLTLAYRRRIHVLRLELKRVSWSTIDELEACFRSIEAYKAGPQSESVRKVFLQIRSVETEELQQSFFLTRCVQCACVLQQNAPLLPPVSQHSSFFAGLLSRLF